MFKLKMRASVNGKRLKENVNGGKRQNRYWKDPNAQLSPTRYKQRVKASMRVWRFSGVQAADRSSDEVLNLYVYLNTLSGLPLTERSKSLSSLRSPSFR